MLPKGASRAQRGASRILVRKHHRRAAMETNEVLTLVLIAAAVIILVLKSRVDRLTHDMHGQATVLFNTWKQRDYDNVRREQSEVARREAASELQRWRLDAEKEIRRDAITRSQAVTV